MNGATRRKRADKADAESLTRIPSARTITRLLTTSRDNLTKSETVTIAAIESGVPLLVTARDIIADFHLIIRRKAENELMPWIDRARDSLVASFGNGVAKDIQAVRAAIVSPWSNGQTEGQITKLKLGKRQMYRRGKLDLLQARLFGATERIAPSLRQSQHVPDDASRVAFSKRLRNGPKDAQRRCLSQGGAGLLCQPR